MKGIFFRISWALAPLFYHAPTSAMQPGAPAHAVPLPFQSNPISPVMAQHVLQTAPNAVRGLAALLNTADPVPTVMALEGPAGSGKKRIVQALSLASGRNCHIVPLARLHADHDEQGDQLLALVTAFVQQVKRAHNQPAIVAFDCFDILARSCASAHGNRALTFLQILATAQDAADVPHVLFMPLIRDQEIKTLVADHLALPTLRLFDGNDEAKKSPIVAHYFAQNAHACSPAQIQQLSRTIKTDNPARIKNYFLMAHLQALTRDVQQPVINYADIADLLSAEPHAQEESTLWKNCCAGMSWAAHNPKTTLFLSFIGANLLRNVIARRTSKSSDHSSSLPLLFFAKPPERLTTENLHLKVLAMREAKKQSEL